MVVTLRNLPGNSLSALSQMHGGGGGGRQGGDGGGQGTTELMHREAQELCLHFKVDPRCSGLMDVSASLYDILPGTVVCRKNCCVFFLCFAACCACGPKATGKEQSPDEANNRNKTFKHTPPW